MRILGFNAPPLSLQTAHILTTAFVVCYVGSIYLSKNARLSFAHKPLRTKIPNGQENGDRAWLHEREKEKNERWRDDPGVIRARLFAVSVATLGCCLLLFAVVWSFVRPSQYKTELTIDTVLARLGLNFNASYPLPYLHIFLLFLGPIYASSLAEVLPLQRRWNHHVHFVQVFPTWQGLRNYVAAPITEELVFRGCVLAVYQLAGAGKMKMIFLGPLSFGAAHVHHAWDTFNRYGRTQAAAQRAIIMSLFQLTYTSIFGSYASFLFLRTSSVYPPIVAHIFCNIMGLPQLTAELRAFQRRRYEILAVYVIGIIAFAWTARAWTKVDHSFYWTGADPEGIAHW